MKLSSVWIFTLEHEIRYSSNFRSIKSNELLEKIQELNDDPKVHGIIVQMPLDCDENINADRSILNGDISWIKDFRIPIRDEKIMKWFFLIYSPGQECLEQDWISCWRWVPDFIVDSKYDELTAFINLNILKSFVHEKLDIIEILW